MPYAKRRKWLEAQTRKTSIRDMAEVCGVTHTTVSRWLSKGIPMQALTELMFRFQADPIEAVVAWGFMDPAMVDHLNWKAFVQYVPMDVLLAEVYRREKAYVMKHPDPLRRKILGQAPSPSVVTMPLRMHG